MNESAKLVGTEKIEHMFANNVDFQDLSSSIDKQNLFKRIRVRHLYLIPGYLIKRIYRILPGFLKDIFFWASVNHKAPSSKVFARTRFDELRTMIDIKISSLALKKAPSHIEDKMYDIFNSGLYEISLPNISKLDPIIDSVLSYAKPSHAGARPYFKDGKNIKIENSFSAYYSFSSEDNQRITSFLHDNLEHDFQYYLSAVAGYKCELKDISYSLGIVFGENSNSEMHQDTFSGIAKGFIYLQDMDADNSPFQYLAGSYQDASFRSKQTNLAVLKGDTYSSGSTRLRGSVLEKAINKYELKTFTGKRGLFVLANTAGYHRKGAHNSSKPRITIGFEIKRKGIFSKAFSNLLR